jgi:hypothetical protein
LQVFTFVVFAGTGESSSGRGSGPYLKRAEHGRKRAQKQAGPLFEQGDRKVAEQYEEEGFGGTRGAPCSPGSFVECVESKEVDRISRI